MHIAKDVNYVFLLFWAVFLNSEQVKIYISPPGHITLVQLPPNSNDEHGALHSEGK